MCRKIDEKKKIVSYEVIGNNHVAVPSHYFKVNLFIDLPPNLSIWNQSHSIFLPKEVSKCSPFTIEVLVGETEAGEYDMESYLMPNEATEMNFQDFMVNWFSQHFYIIYYCPTFFSQKHWNSMPDTNEILGRGKGSI